VSRALAATPVEEVALCSVVKAELLYGAERSRERERNRAQIEAFVDGLKSLPFDDAAAEAYATVRSKLAEQGTPIGPNDLMIAAIALANELILVTHNVREFERVEGLWIEDWQGST
jgi:tRNA(fMet)-specific endonuclease VapC